MSPIEKGAPSHPAGAGGYAPRRPEETVLHRLLSEHLEAFLAHVESRYEKGLPKYVVDELEGYLRCGIFAHGFIRCSCEGCGHDVLVAFSCKNRGICPSCGARRMCNTAAHIVDRVLPNVPVRQWVLSLPQELRFLAAFKPDVLTALGRIFVDAIAKEQRRRCGRKGTEGGAILFPQRFGGSLNLNLHLHAVVIDGVFSRDDKGIPRFHELSPPAPHEIEKIVRLARERALRWLAKHGYLDDRRIEDESNEAPARTALDACADVALRGGVLARLEGRGAAREDEGGAGDSRFAPRRRGPFSVEVGGFNVQAAVRIEATDDEGRERLLRYCARPSFALDRLSVLKDGRVAYRLKYPSRNATHRIMTPVELLARLVAMVPPPRYPLVRYSGVLGPHSKWRSAIIPRAPSAREEGARHAPCATGEGSPAQPAVAAPHGPVAPAPGDGSGAVSRRRRKKSSSATTSTTTSAPLPAILARAARIDAAAAADPSRAADGVEGVEGGFRIITVHHWNRLLGGRLLARAPRVPWATLMRRTYDVDLTQCPKCHGPMRVLAAITRRDVAGKILRHLGLPADPPARRGRRRDPDPAWEDGAPPSWGDG